MLLYLLLALLLVGGIPAAYRIHKNFKARLLADCKDGQAAILKAIAMSRDRWELKAISKFMLAWEKDWVRKVDRGKFNKLMDELNKAFEGRKRFIQGKAA